MLRGILAIGISLVVTGCGTPYQPKGFTGGYEEMEMKPGVYFLSFEGNGYTSSTTVAMYWHRRAKELCAQSGQVFEVMDTAATNEIRGAMGYSPGIHGGFQSMSVIRKAAHTGYIRCVAASGEKEQSPP